MKRVTAFLSILALVVLLAACQQGKPDARLDALPGIASSSSAAAEHSQEAAQGIDALASDLDVLTAGLTDVKSSVTGLQGDVQALTTAADELSSLTAQVQSLAGILTMVNPATTGLLNVQFDAPLQLTVTPGACPADLPVASTLDGGFKSARAIAFMGLPVGDVCLASSDPPAGVTMQVAAKQMLSVFFAPPAAAE